jgi:hypothetical protein
MCTNAFYTTFALHLNHTKGHVQYSIVQDFLNYFTLQDFPDDTTFLLPGSSIWCPSFASFQFMQNSFQAEERIRKKPSGCHLPCHITLHFPRPPCTLK